MSEPGPEDVKLITLARSARARSAATQGAAVRDADGRTYAAASVELPSLRLSALQVAVAMAVSSGVIALEAAAVVRPNGPADEAGMDAVRELSGSGLPVLFADPTGAVRTVLMT